MQWQNIVYYLVWAGLIFFMMRYGCGAHIMGHGHRHSGSHAGRHGRWSAPDQAVDPVCGMTIATATARSTVQNGHIYFFCSAECRAKFEAAPASFGAGNAATNLEEHHHGRQ